MSNHIEKRRRVARIVDNLKKIGYSFLLISLVTFFIAAMLNYNSTLLVISSAGLLTACVILPVPIILGYGVKAAQREDSQIEKTKP